MTTIFERVSTALAGLGTPYANQVYIPATGNSLPDTYLVYHLVSAPTTQHADDAEKLRENRVQISIYSRSGLVGLPDVAGAMLAAGFTPAGKYQIPYDLETRHFAIAQDFIYLEES